ncbi:MAG: 50S ribosomal protein L25/general stress protein Ctc [Proteobacteria bacterium]|nr:50S ribosomal protein L25/general stress protein Ctc [Pseudomonadota bacterium]
MSTVISLSASKRNMAGTGQTRALRNSGKLPGIIYGDKKGEQMVALDHAAFMKEYMKGNIQSKLIELNVDGEKITVLPRDVQIHRVTDVPVHVDLQRVGKDTSIRLSIHMRLLGEDKCVGVRKGGVMNVTHRHIECRCHPSNIPQHIDVDVSDLEIGHSVHINDIKLPEGVVPTDRSNFALVSIVGRSDEKAEGEAATSAAAAAPAAS